MHFVVVCECRPYDVSGLRLIIVSNANIEREIDDNGATSEIEPEAGKIVPSQALLVKNSKSM